jgi:hypothetical protein
VPVLLKERVAALLVGLSRQNDDLAGVEVLVQVAELTLDVQAYRKASPAPVAAAEPSSRPAPAPQATAPVYAHAGTAPAGADASIAAPAYQQSVAPPQAHQPVMDEVHDKARRFAKLLVEEIKLYNQTKLAEGRALGDLYTRLREDIEKSRGAYQKRYGESVKDADYFSQELIRILADNNRAMMGPGFPG